MVGILWNRMKVVDLGDASQEGIVQDVAVASKLDQHKPAFVKDKPKKKFEGIVT